MSQRQHAIITIDPPLPCGMVKPDGLCGQPAHKGRVHQVAKSAGQWTITPICRECSLAAMSVLWGGQPLAPPSALPTPPPAPDAQKPEAALVDDQAVATRLKERYVAQFISDHTDHFEDFAYWATEGRAKGHVLMTISSNTRVKAGRVFDKIEQRVIGDIHYRR